MTCDSFNHELKERGLTDVEVERLNRLVDEAEKLPSVKNRGLKDLRRYIKDLVFSMIILKKEVAGNEEINLSTVKDNTYGEMINQARILGKTLGMSIGHISVGSGVMVEFLSMQDGKEAVVLIV